MSSDKQILRNLANEYFLIANSNKNQNNILAHKSVNDLKGQRPIVLISEIPWHEMNIDNELTLYCEDNYLRSIKCQLKQTLYSWKHMPADMVVTPYFGVRKVIHSSGNGFDIQFNDERKSDKGSIKSHTHTDQIQSMEDIEKLHNQVIAYDEEATLKTYHTVADIFGDILPVKLVGEESGYSTACKIWVISPSLKVLMAYCMI